MVLFKSWGGGGLPGIADQVIVHQLVAIEGNIGQQKHQPRPDQDVEHQIKLLVWAGGMAQVKVFF